LQIADLLIHVTSQVSRKDMRLREWYKWIRKWQESGIACMTVLMRCGPTDRHPGSNSKLHQLRVPRLQNVPVHQRPNLPVGRKQSGATMRNPLITPRSHRTPWQLVLTLLLLASKPPLLFSDEPIEVRPEVVLQELNREFCWFHPRLTAIPGYGINGNPAVVMTIQKHLETDDFYSGMYMMRTDDLGKNWSGPTEIPELVWRETSDNHLLSVADVTPGWHAGTQRLIAIGIQVRYSKDGNVDPRQPGSHEFAYAVFQPETAKWSGWKTLQISNRPAHFFHLCPGCVQWLVQPDGTLLVPAYFKGRDDSDYGSTVLHLNFDGETIEYLKHGTELKIEGGRGFVEPSLIEFNGVYHLTLRNDTHAYVATSSDGLTYDTPRRWTFDNGDDLGSFNTQAHWLKSPQQLYLCYTRRGADNDHIFRNRAPLFIAQVDPRTLQVVRSTENVLIPEQGLALGNFGAAAITDSEAWVTDSEFVLHGQAHPRGGQGRTYVSRVRWRDPEGTSGVPGR